MRYLVDSDWLIDAVGGKPSAIQTLDLQHLSAQGLAVSIIAVGEVYEGAFGLPDSEVMLASFREFLRAYTTVPLSDPIVERFARVRAALRQHGQLIPDMDLLIAATALELDLTLVTRLDTQVLTEYRPGSLCATPQPKDRATPCMLYWHYRAQAA